MTLIGSFHQTHAWKRNTQWKRLLAGHYDLQKRKRWPAFSPAQEKAPVAATTWLQTWQGRAAAGWFLTSTFAVPQRLSLSAGRSKEEPHSDCGGLAAKFSLISPLYSGFTGWPGVVEGHQVLAHRQSRIVGLYNPGRKFPAAFDALKQSLWLLFFPLVVLYLLCLIYGGVVGRVICKQLLSSIKVY